MKKINATSNENFYKHTDYLEDRTFDGELNKIIDYKEYDIFSLARHSKFTELENLFIRGVNPDSRDEYGNTILITGAQNGNKRIIKLALRYGAQINMFNNMGNTALHFAFEYKFYHIAEYLIRKGANPDIKNLRGVIAREGVRNDKMTKIHTISDLKS